MRLREGTIFLNLVQTLANGRIIGVVYVNVSTGAWSHSLGFLVASALVAGVEWYMHLHGVFPQNSTFHFIFLLLALGIILTWTRVLQISLFREGSIELILPEITAVSGTQEGAGRI